MFTLCVFTAKELECSVLFVRRFAAFLKLVNITVYCLERPSNNSRKKKLFLLKTTASSSDAEVTCSNQG